MPTEYPLNAPFPNGAYLWENGVGPVYVEYDFPEWSADASPYYTIGQAVKYKGLIYSLNYNWDGTTVGSPSSQVDGDGVRVWTLQCTNYNLPEPLGYRLRTINTDDTFYYQVSQSETIKPRWNFWHNITSAHAGVFEITRYKSNTESGFGRTLLTLASTVEINPVKITNNQNLREVQSINFNDANGIDNKMFAFVTTSCGRTFTYNSYVSPSGIFQYYGNFKYKLNLTSVGTLVYEKSISYTLSTTNWVLNPEYDPTATTPFTYTYTYAGTTYSGSADLFMIFTAETFLGRTYNGAFRVYHDGTGLVERYELDSVTPDLRTS